MVVVFSVQGLGCFGFLGAFVWSRPTAFRVQGWSFRVLG